MSNDSKYEAQSWLDRYLLFHYGEEQDQLPFAFGPKQALNFPVRCVSECVERQGLPDAPTALDLGCSVGRSTFELSRFCQQVVGIDNSHIFIQTALKLKEEGQVAYTLKEEADTYSKRIAYLPKGVKTSHVQFLCQDVMEVTGHYDIVLAANLICRLYEPKKFLQNVHHLLNPLGQLVITTPYSWLEEFTPKSEWLKGENGLASLKNILSDKFELKKASDMPFLMREHLRLYQWGVAQASLWMKK